MWWVNALFTAGQFYGAATLAPMLVGPRKPSVVTSGMVVVPQPLYIAAYLTMSMGGAAAMATLLWAIWGVLLVQGMRQKEPRRVIDERRVTVHHGVPVTLQKCGSDRPWKVEDVLNVGNQFGLDNISERSFLEDDDEEEFRCYLTRARYHSEILRDACCGGCQMPALDHGWCKTHYPGTVGHIPEARRVDDEVDAQPLGFAITETRREAIDDMISTADPIQVGLTHVQGEFELELTEFGRTVFENLINSDEWMSGLGEARFVDPS